MAVAKIEEINKKMTETNDGLPPVNVSVGIIHGSDASDAADLFEKTDAAMYNAKQSGKHASALKAENEK